MAPGAAAGPPAGASRRGPGGGPADATAVERSTTRGRPAAGAAPGNRKRQGEVDTETQHQPILEALALGSGGYSPAVAG